MTDDDELRTRQGKFLDVAETAVGYRETSLKGEITEYIKATCPIEVSIENLTIHVTSDVASGTVRPLLMGNTAEKFRAIGTEGNYQIFQVAISSSIPPGTAVIRSVDSKDGHALRSEMSVGLQDETINKLVERLPGTLRQIVFGIDDLGGSASRPWVCFE